MKTFIAIIFTLLFSSGAYAQQGEQQYAKVPKSHGVKVRPKAVNSRSNPPDMVVLRRQSKAKKQHDDRYRHRDRTAFTARAERKNRGSL